MTKITYQQEYRTDKSGKTYGPYWYGYWREGGKLRKKYYGKQRPPDQDDSEPASAKLTMPSPGTIKLIKDLWTENQKLITENQRISDVLQACEPNRAQSTIRELQQTNRALLQKLQEFSEMAMPEESAGPRTIEEALDGDPLLVDLLKLTGRNPASLLKLVQRLGTSRERLSFTLARTACLWEELGIKLHDATPGTGGGLWVSLEGGEGYTYGRISREERDEVAIPLAPEWKRTK